MLGNGSGGQLGNSDDTYYVAGDDEYYGVNRHAPLAVLVADQGIPLNNIAAISSGGAAHSCALLKERALSVGEIQIRDVWAMDRLQT